MGSFAITIGVLLAAFAAASVAVLTLVGTLHLSRKRTTGWFQIVPYGIVLTSAMLIAYSGRDLSNILTMVTGVAKPGLVSWVQRIATILMLLASFERIARVLFDIRKDLQVPQALLWAYVTLWLGTALSPALLGANSEFSHELFYALIIGIGALALLENEVENLVKATRNCIIIFVAISWLMIFIAPRMVLETTYTQGYLPGVPRFAGLAAHAVSMGMLTQLGLYCLWQQPVKKRWGNILIAVMLLAALFLSQAKSAWISFFICGFFMLMARQKNGLDSIIFSRKNPLRSAALIGLTCITTAIIVIIFVGKGLDSGQAFLNSNEGNQLSTFTGRDKIWAIALAEWLNHPIFGYGTQLFSLDYRMSLGMPNATHAHNQFVDVLARAGLVGGIASIVYVGIVATLSFRHSKTTGGLSIALFLSLFLRSITEVPLYLNGYGHEFLGHLLLLAVLAGAIRREKLQTRNGEPFSEVSHGRLK